MALYTPEYKPNGNEIAVLTTSKGTIRVQLAGNDAPIHVGNFVELSQKGYYDGQLRVGDVIEKIEIENANE